MWRRNIGPQSLRVPHLYDADPRDDAQIRQNSAEHVDALQ